MAGNNFFESSQFDHPNQSNAPVQSNDTDRFQHHAHVSNSQIAKLTRKEDLLVIHRQKITSVTAIGFVLSVEELTTKNVYTIDDYTNGGPIEVQLWKNEENTEGQGVEPPPPIMEKTYIRVVGQVKYDDRKPFIVAYKVEPIVDPNEIPTHFLEVIHDSLILEKRKHATLNKMNTSNMELGNEFSSDDKGNLSGLSEIQQTILKVLDKYGKDLVCGLTRNEIKDHLKSVSGTKVDETLTFLSDEGHIFATNDDDTFKLTGA